MSDRSWFLAFDGQQHGPYPEGQLREFIAEGRITADTLVWTEGMADWQKAGDIPGLFGRAAGRPPGLPRSGGPLAAAGGYGGGPLSIDFGIWEFTWRSLVLFIGFLFIIPTPWVVVMYCRWFVSRLHVPQRPNLTFTGQAVDIWWFFVAVALLIYVGVGIQYLSSISSFRSSSLCCTGC